MWLRHPREWKNAYWNGEQMVYGQIKFRDGAFLSVATMLDVVGHEMFHGVTDFTSRLEYRTQPGALNESDSDIFGVIIANFKRPLASWTWELGAGFDGPGTALRDLEDPTKHEQPKLMRDFKPATPPYTFDRNDYGWVHDNSGIHNYAAFRIMTAKTGTTCSRRRNWRASCPVGVFVAHVAVYGQQTGNGAGGKVAVSHGSRARCEGEGGRRWVQRGRDRVNTVTIAPRVHTSREAAPSPERESVNPQWARRSRVGPNSCRPSRRSRRPGP